MEKPTRIRFRASECRQIIDDKMVVSDQEIAKGMEHTPGDTGCVMLQMWVQLQILRQLEELNKKLGKTGKGK